MRGVFLVLIAVTPAFATGDAAKGKALFATCAGCHNTESNQRKMGPSLRSLFGKVTLHSGKRADDENVRAIVLDGYNGMPSFRYSFRPAEIDDLMAYLHTLTAKPVEAAAPPGETYFKAYCIRCHNPEVRASVGPDLRGRFRQAWVRKIEEGHDGSPALKDWLDDSARSRLLEYLRDY